MMNRHVIFFCFIFGIACLCGADTSFSAEKWGYATKEEEKSIDDLFGRAWDLLSIINKTNDEAAWRELKGIPPKALLPLCVRGHLGFAMEPKQFNRLRGMVLAIPDWDGWVQWKIDDCRALKAIEAGPKKIYPGAENEPKLIPEKNWINMEGYIGLSDTLKFLRMIGTVETVPLMAQFLEFPYIDPLHGALAFPGDAAGYLELMKIPGAPTSVDPKDWKKWWKANAHLYRKGPDGKIHGPAPTQLVISDGKLPGYTQLPPIKEPLPNPPPPPATPQPRPSPTKEAPAAIPQPATAEPSRSSLHGWKWPTALAFCALGVLAFLLCKRKKEQGDNTDGP